MAVPFVWKTIVNSQCTLNYKAHHSKSPDSWLPKCMRVSIYASFSRCEMECTLTIRWVKWGDLSRRQLPLLSAVIGRACNLEGGKKGSSESVSSDSKYLYQILKVLTSKHLDNYSISKGIIVSLFPSGFYQEGLRAYLYPMVRVGSQNLPSTFFNIFQQGDPLFTWSEGACVTANVRGF